MASFSVATSEGSARASAAAIAVTSNINYGPSTFDLYFPGAKRGSLRPAVVLVHGGGWTSGDKKEPQIVAAAKDIANAGFAVFNINYPLATATVPGYPMELEAIAAAVQHVKINGAKYYIDPRRVGLLGGSAGANLVHAAGLLINQTKPGAVRAVSGLSGYTQLWETYVGVLAALETNPTNAQLQTGLRNIEYYLGCPGTPCSQTTAEAASPYSNVNPYCPVIDIHNSENESVPLEQVFDFANALTAVGCTAEVEIMPGGAHGFKYWSAAKGDVIDFFKRRL
jgi:acetyl esterase/lipase